MGQKLPPHLIDAVVELRKKGYAVALFSPEELNGCPADDLESALVNDAWDQIDHIKQQLAEEAS
jgi:hypothetical protein